ncbi:hypothetical protein [Shewanella youngdeokensis]|uniref:Galanin n=1 Tax=Shewanella youngdeokensis TaxID=2999068 RepID=A0ABZ0JXA4_9GAMM|nr:hypothetical protein RGE70_16355 [Shewanella sp. DAU334]
MNLKDNKIYKWLKDDHYHKSIDYLDEITNKIEASTTVDELNAIIDDYQESVDKRSYSFFCSRSVNILNGVLMFVVMTYMLAAYVIYEVMRHSYRYTQDFSTYSIGVFVFLFFVFKAAKKLKAEKKDKLVEYIKLHTKNMYAKMLLVRHGTKVNPLSKDAFHDFGRGNYSDKVYAYAIEPNEELASQKKSVLFRSSHTNRYKRTEGRGKDRRVYYEYKTWWRYGVIFGDDNRHASVRIAKSQSVVKSADYKTFKPSLISFEKEFYSEGINQIAVADFLTPKMMLNIEDLAKSYENLTVEVDDKKHVLVSQNNIDLLPPLEGYITFDSFKNELYEKTSLDKFITFSNAAYNKIYK